LHHFSSKYVFFKHNFGSIFEIPLRINPLFVPSIAHEQIAQNANFAVRLLLFALFLTSLSRSRNQGSLKSE